MKHFSGSDVAPASRRLSVQPSRMHHSFTVGGTPTAQPPRRRRYTARALGSIAGVFAPLIALFLLFAPAAHAEVLKITLDDTINPITYEYIERAIAEAGRTHANALLIELNTPGGLLDSTRRIMEKMMDSPVPVIVYVTPSGSRAASAGFFIMQAADVAAMAPGTNTGAAHPVALGGGQMDQVMKEKLENDSAAFMRSVVSKRGRNVDFAESAVRQSKSFSEGEALKNHVIDFVAKDRQDLFRQLEGKPITRFDGKQVQLHLASQTVRDFPMTLKQRLLDAIMDPNVAFILLAIGLMAIYAEFNHPGAVIPGVVGLIFVVLAIFAFNLLPTRYAAMVLILVAFLLFALEAKFATHGVLAVGGMVSMIMGALLLVDAPIPEMRIHLLTAAAVSLPIGVITVFLVSIALRARQNKIATGTQGMVGAIAIARTPLAPEGKVFIHGELWNARSSAPVESGAEVRVQRVEGLTVYVDPK